MNNYVKEFFKRGLMFSGFGPIIVGIVNLVLNYTNKDFSLTGIEAFLGILSVYILAFIVAGASIFNQIESWSTIKSLIVHGCTLYVTYLVCYLLNTWIPFKLEIVLIFTGIFILTYLLIWLIVYLSVKGVSRKFNKKIS